MDQDPNPHPKIIRKPHVQQLLCGQGHVVEVVLKAGPSRKDVELEEEEEDDHVLHPEATSIKKRKRMAQHDS